MSQGKKVAFVTKAQLVRAEDIWIGKEEYAGKFVLRCTAVVDKNRTEQADGHRQFKAGEDIRTSFLVRIDLEKNEFETMNTIYKVVPEVQTDVYTMCVPQ